MSSGTGHLVGGQQKEIGFHCSVQRKVRKGGGYAHSVYVQNKFSQNNTLNMLGVLWYF